MTTYETATFGIIELLGIQLIVGSNREEVWFGGTTRFSALDVRAFLADAYSQSA